MLAKVRYEDIEGNTLKGIVNGKEETFLMRVIVNKDNIRDAITKYGYYNNVVSFDYYGDVSGLANLPNTPKSIILHKDMDGIDEVNLDLFLQSVPYRIKVALKLPITYTDMRTIIEMSEKYKNITFCGGNLIRLPGARIGCIQQEDCNKKISNSKIPLVCKGCACIYENIAFENIEGAYFTNTDEKIQKVSTYKSNEVKPVNPQTVLSKGKKAVNSLAALFGDSESLY